tara:strand:- start:491 stop:748 length:258 start_codon:yes stop_codon:yes gene_type:complete
MAHKATRLIEDGIRYSGYYEYRGYIIRREDPKDTGYSKVEWSIHEDFDSSTDTWVETLSLFRDAKEHIDQIIDVYGVKSEHYCNG